MQLDFSEERILAVVAHPDDAELLCAGTLARARSEGAHVAICVLCQGEKGQPEGTIADLAIVRRDEMQSAAEILSAKLFTTEVPDSTLRDRDNVRGALVAVMREFRPTLLLGHAPEDYHADHRAASLLTETCSWLCASSGQTDGAQPLETPPELWWMDTVGMQQFAPTMYVDISQFVAVKEQMLNCHASQLQRAGEAGFVSLRDLMRNQYETRGLQSGVAAAEVFRPHHSFKRTRAW